MHFIRSSLLTVYSLCSFSALAATVTTGTACNNSPSLCSKTYDSITHLGAHDSPFLRDASTRWSTSGNQFYNSTVQLSAGVRMLTGQIYMANSTTSNTEELHLCHSSCSLFDAGSLVTWLSGIKTWLDAHPYEVVTLLLVNSDNVATAEIAADFVSANIASYAYKPPSSSSPPARGAWPTLSTLIQANTRLVTFVASLESADSSASYLMDEFTFVFENPYDVTDASGFSCQPQRPTSVANNPAAAVSAGLMPLMNHFLYDEQLLGIEVPDVQNITLTNAYSGSVGALGTAANQCTSLWGRTPTFLLVDFFNVGPAIYTADRLNGITGATGRTNVSTAVLTAASQTSAASGRTGNINWIVPVVVAIMGAVYL